MIFVENCLQIVDLADETRAQLINHTLGGTIFPQSHNEASIEIHHVRVETPIRKAAQFFVLMQQSNGLLSEKVCALYCSPLRHEARKLSIL